MVHLTFVVFRSVVYIWFQKEFIISEERIEYKSYLKKNGDWLLWRNGYMVLLL